jgi:hypothetical protein
MTAPKQCDRSKPWPRDQAYRKSRYRLCEHHPSQVAVDSPPLASLKRPSQHSLWSSSPHNLCARPCAVLTLACHSYGAEQARSQPEDVRGPGFGPFQHAVVVAKAPVKTKLIEITLLAKCHDPTKRACATISSKWRSVRSPTRASRRAPARSPSATARCLRASQRMTEEVERRGNMLPVARGSWSRNSRDRQRRYEQREHTGRMVHLCQHRPCSR